MNKEMNAKKVLENVNACIAELEEANTNVGLPNWERMKYKGWSCKKVFKMDAVYDELSIFDWWTEQLTMSRLKQMKHFLETAIKYGYTGYVCFKVGLTGCANGMWAHKNESTDGYSPDGEVLYRSFTPAYTCWDAKLADGSWVGETYYPEKEYGNVTLTDVKKYIA